MGFPPGLSEINITLAVQEFKSACVLASYTLAIIGLNSGLQASLQVLAGVSTCQGLMYGYVSLYVYYRTIIRTARVWGCRTFFHDGLRNNLRQERLDRNVPHFLPVAEIELRIISFKAEIIGRLVKHSIE